MGRLHRRSPRHGKRNSSDQSATARPFRAIDPAAAVDFDLLLADEPLGVGLAGAGL